MAFMNLDKIAFYGKRDAELDNAAAARIEVLTSRPPADLVTRLREVEEWFHGRRSGKLEAARLLREAIEVLTQLPAPPVLLAPDPPRSGSATREDAGTGGVGRPEPVAGEVERFTPIARTGEGFITAEMMPLAKGRWVRKSSYDALRAAFDSMSEEVEIGERRYDALTTAKAKAEDEYLRAWNERDAQRRRAEAAERQRNALREALTKARDYFKVEYGKVGQIQSVSYANEDLRKVVAFLDAALKDEGSAT